MFNHQYDSKEQGSNHETREALAILMMSATVLKKCGKEMDGETSQNEDAGWASV